MSFRTHGRLRTIGIGGALALLVGALAHAQARADVGELRAQLRVRYDVVLLQQGVALVPRARTAGVRMIQIADGIVTVDGETLTGRQLTDRLGRDATLVVQVSYLDRAAQQELAAPAPPASPAPPAMPAPPAPPSEPAPPAAPAEPAPPAPEHARYGDVVRVGGDVVVRAEERVDGDVVAILGGADIDGEVTHDVTVVLGRLTLGPNAVVRGDIALIGGRLDRAAGAVVFGKIDMVGFSPFGAGPGASRAPLRLRELRPGPIGTVGGTVTRIVLLVLLGLVAIGVARNAIERVGERAAINPVQAGLVGLLAELLFIPAIVSVVVVLAVSIVGIPLLILVPFAIGAVLLLMLVGFVGAAYETGAFLTRRTMGGSANVYLTLAIGVLAVVGVTLVARILWVTAGGYLGLPLLVLGYVLEYLAWTIGFGALILAWFNRHDGRIPIATGGIPPAAAEI